LGILKPIFRNPHKFDNFSLVSEDKILLKIKQITEIIREHNELEKKIKTVTVETEIAADERGDMENTADGKVTNSSGTQEVFVRFPSGGVRTLHCVPPVTGKF